MKGQQIFDNVASSMESIKLWIPRLPPQDTVDVGARLRALKNRAEKMDETITDILKTFDVPLVGRHYQAVITRVEKVVFDISALKEADPATYAAYLKERAEIHLTYKPV